MYRELIHVLFSQLAVGGLVCILPVPETAGKRFFRFCGLLSVALLGLAVWSAPASSWTFSQSLGGGWDFRPLATLLFLGVLVIALLFVCAAMTERNRLKQISLPVAGVLGMAGVVLDSLHAVPADAVGAMPLLYAASAMASTLFLGSVIYAMILGHWYLVVPALPNKPLESLARVIVGTTASKAIIICAVLATFWSDGNPEMRTLLLRFLRFEDIFFAARVLFGMLGPGLLAYMIWETVRIHSTQSATGLLYVATVFVLIGEAFSGYLTYTTSIPL